MSIVRKFLPGVLFTSFAFAVVAIIYIGDLLWVAQTGFIFIAPKEPRIIGENQELKIVRSLIQLSHLTSLAGLDKYTALFIGSAGAIEANIHDEHANLSAKFNVMNAVAISKNYGESTGDFQPYFDASINAALALIDLGEVVSAKKVALDAIQTANAKSPGNHQIQNLKRVVAFLDL